eukprot:CAMPEP_0117883170 /NCGR_PEP_ID=MMETSP0950-20121206/17941_1 /TAXON_ID=44440 /ORGANISM="Chattonella subsalsa, Strain CCMP2191" /LENGTH=348 /DNA_ID=CAMNT_0005738927 /DNA_START=208 /DNA_END=1254 /DNA_ORIENTATION=+
MDDSQNDENKTLARKKSRTIVFSRQESDLGLPDNLKGTNEKLEPKASQDGEAFRKLVHQSDAYGNQQEIRDSDSSEVGNDDPSVVDSFCQGTNTKQSFIKLCCSIFTDPFKRKSTKAQGNAWEIGVPKKGTASRGAGGQPTAPPKTAVHSSREEEPTWTGPTYQKLLPPKLKEDQTKPTLVLDLDETLVHSSFKVLPHTDYIIPVSIDNQTYRVYVCKRPGVHDFLIRMAKSYEIIIYTASLSKYADPLLDLLDTTKIIRGRLFREHCTQVRGNYVKDLGRLNRDIKQTLIIDNSANSFSLHPRSGIQCTSFIEDLGDRELEELAEFLESIKHEEDFRGKLNFVPQPR